jgi:hypothetical protein
MFRLPTTLLTSFVLPFNSLAQGVVPPVEAPRALIQERTGMLPGTDLVVVVVSGECGACVIPKYESAIRRLRPLLTKQATIAGMSFGLIGVSANATIAEGLQYFKRLGQFDELVVGRSWFNTAELDYIFRARRGGMPSIPQVVIVERELSGSLSHPKVGRDTILARYIGTDEIIGWATSGARVPGIKDSTWSKCTDSSRRCAPSASTGLLSAPASGRSRQHRVWSGSTVGVH